MLRYLMQCDHPHVKRKLVMLGSEMRKDGFNHFGYTMCCTRCGAEVERRNWRARAFSFPRRRALKSKS